MYFKVYHPGYFYAMALTKASSDADGGFPHGIAKNVECKESAEVFKIQHIDKEIAKTDKKKIANWTYIRDLYLEANLFGFKVVLPDMESEPKRFKFDGKKTIKMPMTSASGVGEDSALEMREFLKLGPIKSKKEFMARTIEKVNDKGQTVKSRPKAGVLKALDFDKYCEDNDIPLTVSDNLKLF